MTVTMSGGGTLGPVDIVAKLRSRMEHRAADEIETMRERVKHLEAEIERLRVVAQQGSAL